MFRRSVLACALGAGALILAHSATAATITVDGNASDWGFSVADNNASTFALAGGLNVPAFFIEDSDDLAGDSGVVGPNLGGQNYDAEAMAVALQGSNLMLVIVTGQRPDNGLERFGPGDLRISTSGGSVYGIEIGGGVGGGAGTALANGAAGSTYTLNSNGYTTAHAAANVLQSVGSIWLNPTWILDPIVPQTETQMQIGGGGSHVGDVTSVYTRNSTTTQHAVIEMSIPLSVFNGATITNIFWSPSCGNDELSLATQVVPEPGSLSLAALALLVGVPVALRRRKK